MYHAVNATLSDDELVDAFDEYEDVDEVGDASRVSTSAEAVV